jgi:DNA polymerase III alpha subunit
LQPPVALAHQYRNCNIIKTEEEAEQEFKWWLDLFGEDFYVEFQRHGMADQDKVNGVLIRFATKAQRKSNRLQRFALYGCRRFQATRYSSYVSIREKK